jgi:hypothetical protein
MSTQTCGAGIPNGFPSTWFMTAQDGRGVRFRSFPQGIATKGGGVTTLYPAARIPPAPFHGMSGPVMTMKGWFHKVGVLSPDVFIRLFPINVRCSPTPVGH